MIGAAGILVLLALGAMSCYLEGESGDAWCGWA